MRRTAAATLLVLFLASLLLAQEGNAALTGFIQDSFKAVVPDVHVLAINTNTNQHFEATTGKDGSYNIASLPVGPYRMQIDKAGFRTILKEDIFLHTQDVLQINFQMAIGSTSETVTVSGDSVNINTSDASVSTVIDRQFADNLPLNGRSFQSLLYLSPGVTPNVTTSNLESQGQFVVNGQRGDANYWMVDGVSANIGMNVWVPGAGVAGAVGGTNALGGTSALVSVDALQEFRMETSTFSPEFGREPGGQISIQTRSGTNQYHGTAFDYLRNTVLDATDWFADHDGLAKAAEIQNDFGGVLGGPILRDKTFFFLSLEGLRLIEPQTYLGTVPDLATRTSAASTMQPYIDQYPLPKPGAVDTSPGSGLAPYSATFSNPGTANAYSLRIDHQLLKNLSLFARYNHAPSSQSRRGGSMSANTISQVVSITKTATVGATWTKSSQIIDDARFNYSVAGGSLFFNTDNFGGGTPFPSAHLFPAGTNIQNSNIEFDPNFGTGMTLYYGLLGKDFQHQLNAVDTLSVLRGPHSSKFGVDYRRLSLTVNNGLESLVPLFDNIADMAAGKSFLTYNFLSPPGLFVLRNLGIFGQDTWRVTPRFNLTYGVRWDVDFVPDSLGQAKLGSITGYSTSNLSNLAVGPLATPPYSTRYANLAPRIGGAYRMSTNPDWGRVLRGGFGVFYGLASTEIYNNSYVADYYPIGAYSAFTTYNNLSYVPFPTPPSVAQLPNIQPPNVQNQETIFGFDPHFNVPLALQWNVTLEQSLAKAQSFTLSYVGASDKRLIASEYVTNPNPNYASANLIGNAGSSSYQALQAQFRRQLTNGLQALLSYSWSHSIDTGSYGAYSNGSFSNPNANRGSSDYDVRQLFSTAVTYSVPELKNNFFTRAITGGWSTDNIVQIHTGLPVDVQCADFSAISQDNASVLIRCDSVPGQPQYLTGSQFPGRKALNPAYFTDPPVDPTTGLPTRQGDIGRNALRSLGMWQWDFAAHREFSIYERLKVQFRAELFNVLNHPNFGPFNNTFRAGNVYFGQPTTMLNQYLGGEAGTGTQSPLYTPGGSRSGELALKLIF